MTNKILLKKSSVAGKVPLTTDLDYGELALNYTDDRLYFKKSDNSIAFIGTVPIENTIFVQKGGSDSNSGKTWDDAYATVEEALVDAQTRNGAITLIEIAPGEYITQGHLDVPDNCIIRAAHRSVVFKPAVGYEERNVFRLGSGCFLEGPLFEGWRVDNLDNPTTGFAVSFRPGAVITRAPYAHKIAVRTTPYWDTVAPPLDRNAGNPLVGRGAGVVLADGAVCSPYSIYPNIMTWGATPVTHNGIGYCAKNGALINAVNAVSIWSHKHFLALSGGQIILSSCSTQFGDYTLVSSGYRDTVEPTVSATTSVLDPVKISGSISVSSSAASTIRENSEDIIDNMWSDLVSGGYTTGWTPQDETFTRRDAARFLEYLAKTFETGNENIMLDFARGLYYADGTAVFDSAKTSAFVFSFNNMKDQITTLLGAGTASDNVSALVAALNSNFSSPAFITAALSVQTAAATAIDAAKQTIIDDVWDELYDRGFTTGWTNSDEVFTRRDTGTLLQSISWVLQTANEKPMLDFARGLFDFNGVSIIDTNKLEAFRYSFNYIRDEISSLANVNATSDNILAVLFKTLDETIMYPTKRRQPSTITAIGHTWTGILSGVALTKIPPVQNEATITDSILEINQGVVIASGQDDQGSALFVGGMRIDADTGELTGPPFIQAVNRIATKAAIARSF
jgi:hypothetical protein